MRSKLIDAAEAFDAAWKRLHEETPGNQPPPANAITAERYAKLNGISVSSANFALRSRARAGKLNSGLFRVPCGVYTRSIRHFWP